MLVSLHLFARDGYEAVSVSRIAGKLGITKGALYRHFESKRDIFDHIVERMEQGDSSQAAQYDVPEKSIDDAPGKYHTTSLNNFTDYCKAMFTYWTEDDFASSFRKMLTLEQFRSEEMQALYQQYLVSGPLGYVMDLFKSMGLADAEHKAIRLYSNMFLFYSLYDGAEDKETVKKQFEQAMDEITKNIRRERNG